MHGHTMFALAPQGMDVRSNWEAFNYLVFVASRGGLLLIQNSYAKLLFRAQFKWECKRWINVFFVFLKHRNVIKAFPWRLDKHASLPLLAYSITHTIERCLHKVQPCPLINCHFVHLGSSWTSVSQFWSILWDAPETSVKFKLWIYLLN